MIFPIYLNSTMEVTETYESRYKSEMAEAEGVGRSRPGGRVQPGRREGKYMRGRGNRKEIHQV